MKIQQLNLAAVVIGLSMMFASAAEARDYRAHTDSINTHAAYSESSSNNNFGIGFSTYPSSVGTGSVAALLGLGKGHALQFNLTIPTTSPFSFVGGALYKYTIFDAGQGMGFHIGGGGLFGSVNSGFFMQAGGVAGFHFNFPGTNNHIAVHFDGGPIVTVVNGGGALGGSSTTFGISPYSSLVGLSAFYMF